MQYSNARAAKAAMALVVALSLLAGPPASAFAVGADEDWPTYHRTPDRAGVAAMDSTFTDVQPAWSSTPLDGPVYAEPLYVSGRVLVATENNTVYSFDAASGMPVWQTHLAEPAAASGLPCGNIRPNVGITGTPTVDASRGVLYAAAMVSGNTYELFAVDLASGIVDFHRPLDQAGLDPAAAGQRGALALQQGRVYIPFGGRFGDCGAYHGQVVAASTTDPSAPLLAYTTPARRAGVWAPGGVAIADDGTLYVATGNGDATEPEGRTEAVLGLSPMLEELSSWQPTDWLALDKSDTDIGSVPPALLPDLGLLFQTGKNGKGYLLGLGALGGVGGELASASVPADCGRVFGGTAYLSPMLYVPCGSRVVALQVANNPPAFSLAWAGPDETGQPTVGSPIVAAGAVWDIDLSGRLFALDPATGRQRFQVNLPGSPVHFAALAYGGGQVYVTGSDGLAAFRLVGLTGPSSSSAGE
jgi:outer membrane protein assembly factor BamB